MDPQVSGLPVWAVILVATISALPPTLLALAAFLAAIRNGQKTERAADSVIKKLDVNTGMTAKIEEQTNGLADKLRAEIATLKTEVAELRRLKGANP